MSAPISRAHPWHSLETGPNPPSIVNEYIEITPRDVIKYELEKESGLLQVDRVQQSSSSPPTLYGMIPQTYCGPRMADLSPSADRADFDPLDILCPLRTAHQEGGHHSHRPSWAESEWLTKRKRTTRSSPCLQRPLLGAS